MTVFVLVPARAGVQRLWVRTVPDGEPHYGEARVDRTTAEGVWWRAEVPVTTHVTRYRFLADAGPGRQWWLTAAGLVGHDVPDTNDFRLSTHPAPPAWLADAVCYQVFPDRFASSGRARDWPSWASPASWDDRVDLKLRGRQVYGGDLPGLEARLDHVAGLGANLLYLTPFFPSESCHRYDAASFHHVDPLLGGDEALVSLVRAAHARGIRVIGDLTTNHSGRTHEWFLRAQADPASPEAGFYVFRHHPDDYECWLGVARLPKLDWRSAELRRRLVEGSDSVVARWVSPPYGLDGWRIDVANMTGRLGATDLNREAATAIRATLREVAPDAYLVAEHSYDGSPDLQGDGWHGQMAYAGFSEPVWQWLGEPNPHLRSFGTPAGLPSRNGREAAATMTAFAALVPWTSLVANLNLLDSHDTPRFRTIAGSVDRAIAGLALLMTWPGVPMVFAGDEVGVEGTSADLARAPFPWDDRRWDHRLLDAYRTLITARRAHRALRHGGLRWLHVGDEVLVYERATADERVLVQVSRGNHPPVVLPPEVLGSRAEVDVMFGDERIESTGEGLVLPAAGPGARLWSSSSP